MTEPVYLGLGANVGDALETLTAAVEVLHGIDGFAVIDVSGVYETPPWPPPEDPRAVPQDPFLNLVVAGVTGLEPHELLAETRLIETAFGRDRSREVRWGPRTLDIDLLLVGDRVLESPDLVLPHPRIAERGFVLVPLLEVMPGGTLPDGRRLTRLLLDLGPLEDIDLVVRLEDVPGARPARPEGPAGPPASFARPGQDQAAADQGAPPAERLDTSRPASDDVGPDTEGPGEAGSGP